MKTISLLTLGLLLLACEMLTGTKNTEPGVWTAVTSGIPANVAIQALAVSDSILFVGTSNFAETYNGDIYRSTDEGQSWVRADALGIPGSYVEAFALSGSNLFAALGGGGVFRSTDKGQNWTRADEGLSWGAWAFAVSGSYIFATGGDGVYRSTDDGQSWTEVSSGIPSFTGVYSFAVSEENIFAGAEGGVYHSTDKGQNWTAAGSGLPVGVDSSAGVVVQALAVSRAQTSLPGFVVAASTALRTMAKTGPGLMQDFQPTSTFTPLLYPAQTSLSGIVVAAASTVPRTMAKAGPRLIRGFQTTPTLRPVPCLGKTSLPGLMMASIASH